MSLKTIFVSKHVRLDEGRYPAAHTENMDGRRHDLKLHEEVDFMRSV